MAKSSIEKSSLALALESAARSITFNTANRLAASDGTRELAKEIVAVKRVGVVADEVREDVKRSGSPAAALFREEEKWRNVARIRGHDTPEGLAALRKADDAQAAALAIEGAVIASRTAWLTDSKVKRR